jgi:phage terminase large subunit
VEDHARDIKAFENGIFTTVADPEDAEGRATLERCGISTMPAEKPIPAGVQAVQKRLEVAGDGLPRLFVDRDCVNLINELYQYRWPDPKDGAAKKEEPVKDNDHAMDAMRYMVMEADHPRQYAVEAPSGNMKPKPSGDSFASIF